MSDNVESLAAQRAIKAGDNKLWTPVDCLQDCINDFRSDKENANKLVIVTIFAEPNKFNVGYAASNISASEMLAALEILKAKIIKEMEV